MSLNVLNPGSSFRYLHSLAKHRTGAASRRLTVRKWYYFGQAGPFVSKCHCGSPTVSIAYVKSGGSIKVLLTLTVATSENMTFYTFLIVVFFFLLEHYTKNFLYKLYCVVCAPVDIS